MKGTIVKFPGRPDLLRAPRRHPSTPQPELHPEMQALLDDLIWRFRQLAVTRPTVVVGAHRYVSRLPAPTAKGGA
jgi:hypothetical protein